MTAVPAPRRALSLPGRGQGDEPEWPVLLTVAVALALGMLVQATLGSPTRRAEAQGVSFSYPASWSTTRIEGAVLGVRDVFGGSPTPQVSVHHVGTADPATAAATWMVGLAERHLAFHVATTRSESVNGRPATRIEYTYVVARAGSPPVLMRGIDTIASTGDRSFALSFAAPSERFDELVAPRLPRLSSTFDDIRSSWRLP